MRVVIAGGTGFLGTRLRLRLADEGHQVSTLTRRRAASPDQITWTPDGTPGNLPAHLDGVNAVVNLAGEGLANRPWTRQRKEAIRTSRLMATQTLVRAIRACTQPPAVFVSASGVGYYGPHGDEPVSEATPPGTDFLARLCVEWEQEAHGVEPATTRLALIRTGLVLARDGGALKRMLLPFRLGLGATLGTGDQFMPWIHADDWTGLVAWILQNERAAGPFNAAAPAPVTNRTFTRTLGRVLKRPAILHAPAFALRAVMGELSAVLLTGQRALPVAAEQMGFRFSHRLLEPALQSLHL